jgi:putative flippase GtrA
MIWLLIPAYQPDIKLLHLIEELNKKHYLNIIIINDGSSNASNFIFSKLSTYKNVKIIRHKENRGKGAAIKSGIRHYIKGKHRESIGLITLDADGQHTPNDVIKLYNFSLLHVKSLNIGSRNFYQKNNVPFRSMFGNKITSYIFKAFFKKNIKDTQSGLRFIPNSILTTILQYKSHGYALELEMLISAVKEGISVKEMPIKTIYLDSNNSSHFRPIIDSLKIYFVFLRFGFCSLITSFIDYTIFFLSYKFGLNLFQALLQSRVISGLFNFVSNKFITFRSHRNLFHQLPKYLTLVIVNLIISYYLITFFTPIFFENILAAKLISELLLFFVSFLVMNFFIFNKK